MKAIWNAYKNNKHNKKKINKFYKQIEEKKSIKRHPKRIVEAKDLEIVDDYRFFNSSIWLKHRYNFIVKHGNYCQDCLKNDCHIDVYSQEPNIRLTDYSKFLNTLKILCTDCAANRNLKSTVLQSKNSPIIRRVKKGNEGFYNSPEWIILRNQAFSKYPLKCHCCRENRGEFHADHIKPRSKYPLLELLISNIQILCKRCNLGKSNIDETDWTPQLDDEES